MQADDNILMLGVVEDLPRAGRKPPVLEENQYFAGVDKNDNLRRASDGRPYISKNMYSIWAESIRTHIVEVKEVSKCYVLSRN